MTNQNFVNLTANSSGNFINRDTPERPLTSYQSSAHHSIEVKVPRVGQMQRFAKISPSPSAQIDAQIAMRASPIRSKPQIPPGIRNSTQAFSRVNTRSRTKAVNEQKTKQISPQGSIQNLHLAKRNNSFSSGCPSGRINVQEHKATKQLFQED